MKFDVKKVKIIVTVPVENSKEVRRTINRYNSSNRRR